MFALIIFQRFDVLLAQGKLWDSGVFSLFLFSTFFATYFNLFKFNVKFFKFREKYFHQNTFCIFIVRIFKVLSISLAHTLKAFNNIKNKDYWETGQLSKLHKNVIRWMEDGQCKNWITNKKTSVTFCKSFCFALRELKNAKHIFQIFCMLKLWQEPKKLLLLFSLFSWEYNTSFQQKNACILFLV